MWSPPTPRRPRATRFRQSPRAGCRPRTRSRPRSPRTHPLPTAYLMASSMTGDVFGGPVRPMLMLMTSAPLSAAYRIPRATTSSVATFGEPNRKSQTLSSTLTGMILTLNATPAALMPSFVSWPIVPAMRGCRGRRSRADRVVPDEIERRDEAARRHELCRPGVGDGDASERRIASAGFVTKRRNVLDQRRILIGDAGVEHGDDDRRAGLRLEIPCTLEIDHRQVPAGGWRTADRSAPSGCASRCRRPARTGLRRDRPAPPPPLPDRRAHRMRTRSKSA